MPVREPDVEDVKANNSQIRERQLTILGPIFQRIQIATYAGVDTLKGQHAKAKRMVNQIIFLFPQSI